MFHKLNKNESWELFQKLQNEKAGTLDEIIKKLDAAISKNQELEKKNAELETRLIVVEGELAITKACNEALKDGLVALESKQIQANQYDRLENIEIVGIPTEVEDEKLEEAVIGVAGSIGVALTPRDISACHRMPRGEDTIIRLVNRKDADSLLANASQLKGKDLSAVLGPSHPNVYINPNLCPELKNMRWKTKKLKEAGLIAYYGTNRRGPFVQLEPKGPRHQVFVDRDIACYLNDGQSLDSVLHPQPDGNNIQS